MNQLTILDQLPESSMQHRLNVAGIKTVIENNITYLVFKGIKICRPLVNSCPEVVKREFNIEI